MRTFAFSFSGFINGISFGLGGFAISLSLIFESIGMNETTAHELLYIISSLLALSSSILILKISKYSKKKKI